jgi:hypothetical protein
MRIPAVIIDIDGTLADSPQPSEEHLKDDGTMCWSTWIRSTQYSPAHAWCYKLTQSLSATGYTIVYLTARGDDGESKAITKEWLLRNAPAGSYELFMRHDGDRRHDREQKQDTLINEILPKYEILFAVDDKKANVEMFRELGIPALHCADY